MEGSTIHHLARSRAAPNTDTERILRPDLRLSGPDRIDTKHSILTHLASPLALTITALGHARAEPPASASPSEATPDLLSLLPGFPLGLLQSLHAGDVAVAISTADRRWTVKGAALGERARGRGWRGWEP